MLALEAVLSSESFEGLLRVETTENLRSSELFKMLRSPGGLGGVGVSGVSENWIQPLLRHVSGLEERRKSGASSAPSDSSALNWYQLAARQFFLLEDIDLRGGDVSRVLGRQIEGDSSIGVSSEVLAHALCFAPLMGVKPELV